MQVIAWHFCHVQAFCRLLLPVLVTTVKLWVTDLGWFFLLPTGSLDLFLILDRTTSNFLYLSFFTLFSSSLWRTDTIVQWFQNKRVTAGVPLATYCLSPATLHPLQ